MNKKSLIPLISLAFIWSAYYMASQQALINSTIFSMGFYLRVIVFILLSLIMLLRGELRSLFRIKYVWPYLLLTGILGFLLDATAFIGLSMGSASTGTLILKSDILIIAILSYFIYKIKLNWKEWLAIIFMLIGVFLVMDIDPNNLELMNLGNLFYLLSAFFISLNTFVIQAAQKHEKNPVSDIVVGFYNNLICMLIFGLVSLFRGDLIDIQNFIHDSHSGLMLIIAGICQTLIYLVYYYNIRTYEVWIVKVFLLLMPIITTGFGYLFLNEKITINKIIGGFIVILGAIFVLLEQKNASKKHRLKTE